MPRREKRPEDRYQSHYHGPWLPKPDFGPRPEGIVSVSTLRTKHGGRLCGSVIRRPGNSGDWLCHQPGMLTNGRCKMHGGRNVQAITTTVGKPGGRRSKLLEDLHLTDKFADFRKDPELAELRHEIALTDIQIDRAFKRVTDQDTKENRKEFNDVVNLRRKLVDSVHKNTSAVVPVNTVLAFLHAIVNVTFEFVTDPRQKAAYLSKIRNLSGRQGDQLKMPDVVPATLDVTPVSSSAPAEPIDITPPTEGAS